MTAATAPRGSNEPLCDLYDAVLLDLDGVVYRGQSPVVHAAEVLAAVGRRGVAIGYVTNNAARTPGQVAEHLRELGVPAKPEDVVTSAQAGARLVADLVPPGAAVLVVGGEGIDAAIRERGLRPVRSLAESPAAVIQGYGPAVGWQDLAEAAYAVESGLPWVATNIDKTIPTARGMAPGNGTLVAAVVTASGGSPIVAGKPEPPLHHESVLRIGAAKPLVVGDRLDTDIEGACRVGVDSLLVLTGVTSAEDLVSADPAHRPTYIAADLRGLLEAHPYVELEGDGGWSCRGWTVRIDDAMKIDGGGDPVDGLRALCAAAWNSARLPADAEITDSLRDLGWR